MPSGAGVSPILLPGRRSTAETPVVPTGFEAAHGIRVQRLLTDNAMMYRCSHVFRATAAELAQTAVRPSAPAPDQRKGRALQPDPPRGVDLRPALSIKRRPAPLAVSLGP